MLRRRGDVLRMSDNPEVLKYLKDKDLNYTIEGNHYKVQNCPYCGDKSYHFYINKTTGQCRCVKCDSSGNLYTLKKKCGDISPVTPAFAGDKITEGKRNKYHLRCIKYHRLLVGNYKARRYLYGKWGYTLRDIKIFKLGFFKDDNGTKWLSIPCFNISNLLVNIKFRTIMDDNKEFARVKGMESSLFNVHNLNTKVNYVYICEGESDTITAYTKFKLINVVGVTVGARGFKAEWSDILNHFEVIYIVYDPDVPGQQGAAKLAERLGLHKCKNIIIPSKDLTEFWQDFRSIEYFKVLRDRASMFDVKDILLMKDVLTTLKANLMSDNVLDSGLETPWKKVNKLIGSLVPGDLVVVSGQAKVGKTTFALNVSLHNSLGLSIPTLYYCLEMRPERTITKVISFLRLIPKSDINVDDIDVVNTIFRNKPFYLAHSYSFTPDTVFETIRSAVKRYGIELMVFDHLHYLVRSLSNTASEVSHAVRRFKLLAEELKIPIILIAQPRKLSSKTSRMTVHDLRDTSSIGQDGDTIIILHRDRLQQSKNIKNRKVIFSDTVEVIVEATRYNPGGVCDLKFNGMLSRYFADLKEERKLLSLQSKKGTMVFVF